MMKISALLLSAPALLPAAALAQGAEPAGDCRLRIETSASTWVIRGYDPFANAVPTGTFELIFRNEGDAPCRFVPSFALNQEAFGMQAMGGRSVPYALVDLKEGANATPTAGRTLRSAGRGGIVIPPRSQEVIQYQLQVPDEAITGDGLFSQTVQVEATDSDGMPIAGRQLVVGVDVLPSATIGLAGSYRMRNGQALVDLGELREGLVEAPLQLRVQSTRQYRLTVQSLNNGELQLAGTDWAVPYRVVLDGKTVALQGNAGEISSSQGSGKRVESLPLQFDIGNVSNRRAGIYSDVISISIAPR